MKSYLFLILTIISIICFNGCNSNNSNIKQLQYIPYKAQVSQETIDQRAKDFKRLISTSNFRGILLELEWLPTGKEYSNSMIIESILSLGFNNTLLVLKDLSLLEEKRTKEFIIDCAKYNLNVNIILNQSNFVYAHSSNQFVKNFMKDESSIFDAVVKIEEFNSSLPAGAKISSIVINIEPELFDRINPNRPMSYLYTWGEKNYGIGLDNDIMITEAMKTFSQLKGYSSIPLTISIADFYHDDAVANKISKGKIDDFNKISKNVIVRNTGNKPTEAANKIAQELEQCTIKNSIVVNLQLANHVSISEGAFRKRNWQDFTHSLSYLITKWSEYSSYNGIIVGPLRTIDQLQREE